MMVLSMLIFGGPTLHYFAVALTIGILFGIYSSIFVAAGMAMWLGVKREDLVKAGRQGASTRTIRMPGRWCRVDFSSRHLRTPAPDMATRASPESLAGQARRLYTEELVKGLVRRGAGGARRRARAARQAQRTRRPAAPARPAARPDERRAGLAPRHRHRAAAGAAARRLGDAAGRPAAAGRAAATADAWCPTTPSSSRS